MTDKHAHTQWQNYTDTATAHTNHCTAQVLEACDCLKLLSIYFELCVNATGVVCHQLGLLSTDLHAVGCGGLSRCSTTFASSFSSPAKPSMSPAKGILVIVLLPMLTMPSWYSKVSVMILSRNMLKRVGESRHPCQTPTVVWNQFPMLLLKRTTLVALS